MGKKTEKSTSSEAYSEIGLADIPSEVKFLLEKRNITELRPAQKKAINEGLFNQESILVCTPTASGKTLIAEMAALNTIFNLQGKVVYVVPLKALASEKYKEFKKDYGDKVKIALSIGDLDSTDPFLASYDFIICTAEKLDSLTRHSAPWLKQVKTIIIDEIHLLNDINRGPTLEILITIMKNLVKDMQIIALSATIGNSKELAEWLKAKLIVDNWRPVKLKKGVYYDGTIEFHES
ncbi:MAG: DEAD/DEAH box helicase [Nanoarchaeota archaeon]|nr:DEAD/DEAH box helicase [Nanoarchaeota archaeon]